MRRTHFTDDFKETDCGETCAGTMGSGNGDWEACAGVAGFIKGVGDDIMCGLGGVAGVTAARLACCCDAEGAVVAAGTARVAKKYIKYPTPLMTKNGMKMKNKNKNIVSFIVFW